LKPGRSRPGFLLPIGNIVTIWQQISATFT
jgi:hypothetical protein